MCSKVGFDSLLFVHLYSGKAGWALVYPSTAHTCVAIALILMDTLFLLLPHTQTDLLTTTCAWCTHVHSAIAGVLLT